MRKEQWRYRLHVRDQWVDHAHGDAVLVRYGSGHDVPATLAAAIGRDPRGIHIATGAEVVNHRLHRHLCVGTEGDAVEGVQTDAGQVDQQRVVTALQRRRANPVVELLTGVITNDDRRSPLPAGIGPKEVPREDGPLIGDCDDFDGGIAQGRELLERRADFAIVAR